MPKPAATQSVTLGDVRIHFVPDGGGRGQPSGTFPDADEAIWADPVAGLDDDGQFITSIGGLLLEIGNHRLLVDTGLGPISFDAPGIGSYVGGALLDNLAAVGCAPDDVTDVVLTHMHPDHVGWISSEIDGNRTLTFPNARHVCSTEEWAFWRGSDDPNGPHPQAVQAPLADRLTLVDDGAVLAPGLTAMDTRGHTAGHMSLRLKSGGAEAVILGDIVYGTVQMRYPDLAAVFDADPEGAREVRHRVLGELAGTGTLVVAGHMADRVFGRLRAIDGGYQWIPA